jgi:uncharacterized circularly permuted ATP-grasp superfamily protein
VKAAPERWIAQEVVSLSTTPTVTPSGELVPRHVDLRPFAVYGSELRIIPGGLTRVALAEGEMIVNSSRGGGSKDTWVLSEGGPEAVPSFGDSGGRALPEMPAIPHSTWTGQEQQQQQERSR